MDPKHKSHMDTSNGRASKEHLWLTFITTRNAGVFMSLWHDQEQQDDQGQKTRSWRTGINTKDIYSRLVIERKEIVQREDPSKRAFQCLVFCYMAPDIYRSPYISIYIDLCQDYYCFSLNLLVNIHEINRVLQLEEGTVCYPKHYEKHTGYSSGWKRQKKTMLNFQQYFF